MFFFSYCTQIKNQAKAPYTIQLNKADGKKQAGWEKYKTEAAPLPQYFYAYAPKRLIFQSIALFFYFTHNVKHIFRQPEGSNLTIKLKGKGKNMYASRLMYNTIAKTFSVLNRGKFTIQLADLAEDTQSQTDFEIEVLPLKKKKGTTTGEKGKITMGLYFSKLTVRAYFFLTVATFALLSLFCLPFRKLDLLVTARIPMHTRIISMSSRQATSSSTLERVPLLLSHKLLPTPRSLTRV